MLYIADTADLEAIRHINEFYPLAGVTTNPSIVSREHTDFWTLMQNIRAIIGPEKMLHIQTVQTDAAGMIAEARLLKEKIGGSLYVKIPIGEEGLKATMAIKEQGIAGVTMTAVFTPAQALMAATAGADFVAPYVNRLDNILGNGVAVVAEIAELFRVHDVQDCRVLAASFKNAQQIHECALAGCHSVTIAPDLFKTLISHPTTDAAVAGFSADWQSVYADGTILTV